MHWNYTALSTWHKLGQGGCFPTWQIQSSSNDRHLGLALDPESVVLTSCERRIASQSVLSPPGPIRQIVP